MAEESGDISARNRIAGEIWAKLSKINVNDITETKVVQGKSLTYLSWAHAWKILMENYPDASYTLLGENTIEDCQVREKVDGKWTTHSGCTVMVGVEVNIRGVIREMWLPVMNAKNNALTNPDVRSISDTRMRCLVKCLAMFGLGHYIYAGEDIPDGDETPAPADDKKKIAKPAMNTPADPAVSAEKARVIYDTLSVFAGGCENVSALEKYWTDNKGELEKLKAGDPALFTTLVAEFKAVKDKIKGNK